MKKLLKILIYNISNIFKAGKLIELNDLVLLLFILLHNSFG